MGTIAGGKEQRTFIGISKGTHDDPAKFDEALASAAAKIVKSGVVTKRKGPKWFTVTGVEVEIENQNVKTFRVSVTGP